MCGIVGYIVNDSRGFFPDTAKRFMRQALIMDTLRGDDSTGMFYGYANGKPGWMKQVGDGYSFVNHDDWDLYASKVRALDYAVGHNRAATQGSVNADNAHPFTEGPVTMVHNGTLHDTSGLPYSMAELGVEVDSHAICHNLAKADCSPEGVESVISKLEGAFALVWYDTRDNSLNFIRNDERPLHFVSDGKVTYFMSEALMLAAIMQRLKVRVNTKYIQPDAGVYMKFKEGQLVHTSKMELLDPWEGYNNWRGDSWGNSWSGTGSARSASDTENDINVGGRWKPVPSRCQDLLANLGMTVKDRYQFVTWGSIGNDGKHGVTVDGVIGGTKYSAIIPNLSKHVPHTPGEEYTVRPVAAIIRKGGEPVIICKLVRITWEPDNYHNEMLAQEEARMAERANSQQSPWDDTYSITGYRDRIMTEAEYAEATEGGCDVCGVQPTLFDAEDLDWVSEESFVCGACTHKEKTA